MQTGTEPLVILKSAAGVVSEVIGFFSLFYVLKPYRVAVLVGLSLISPVVGGFVWLYLCKMNQWPFFLGGPDNEPYGVYAVVWGMVTLLPVVFCVRLITSENSLNNIAAVARWFTSREFFLVLLYTALAGLSSLLFYGINRKNGVRALVTSFGMTYERTEQIIIVIWAFALSVIPTIALKVLGKTHAGKSGKTEMLAYLMPLVLSAMSCLLALAVYFALYDYVNLDKGAQIRGLVGLVLRFSIFWGLWLAIDTRNSDSVISIVKQRVFRPFPKKGT